MMQAANEPNYFEQLADPRAIILPEEANHALDLLHHQVKGCILCTELAATRTNTVFGVGNRRPELMIIGEAPGADEDAKGEPFVGRAGQLLNNILLASGMRREDVYIANILKCRPPNNRRPEPLESQNCLPYLKNQLRVLRPKFLCLLGATAAQNLLQTDASIGQLRGKIHQFEGIPTICTFHPAYLLRNPSAKIQTWEDMQSLLTAMGRPIPKTQNAH